MAGIILDSIHFIRSLQQGQQTPTFAINNGDEFNWQTNKQTNTSRFSPLHDACSVFKASQGMNKMLIIFANQL